MPSPRNQKPRLIRRLRMPQLELLAAMARTSTLSAAAQEVNLTQSAASRLLGALSSDLNMRLFERRSRGLTPTAAGRALLERAARLVADIDRAQQELEAIDSGLAGTISIGAGVSSCYVMIPAALTLLMKAAPRILVTVREGTMDELLSGLHVGEIDFLVGRFSNNLYSPDLMTYDLYQPPVVAVCGPNHPWARRRSLDWAELLEEPWILPEADTAMRSALEMIFRSHGRRADNCFLESSSIQTNVAMLRESRLIWILSSDVARYFQDLGALRILKVPELSAPGAFVLAHLRTQPLSPAAQKAAQCFFRAAGSKSQL